MSSLSDGFTILCKLYCEKSACLHNRRDILWRCKCGKEVKVPAVLLKGSNAQSCGCL